MVMYLSSIIFRLALVLGYVDTTTSLLNFMATRQISGLSVSFPSSSSLNQKHVFSSSTRFLSMTSSPDSISVGSSGKPKLDSTSLWRLRILFQKQGFKEQEALFRVRYIPSRNYEPPQGRVLVQDDYNRVVRADERGLAGSWTLSEDKDDRKDGLWIWGLFEEPKYPFLYFSLDIYSSLILASNEEVPIFDGVSIPKNRLNFRFDHKYRTDAGVTLTGGLVTYQMTELIKADPLGIGGTVDVGDFISAGTVELTFIGTE